MPPNSMGQVMLVFLGAQACCLAVHCTVLNMSSSVANVAVTLCSFTSMSLRSTVRRVTILDVAGLCQAQHPGPCL